MKTLLKISIFILFAVAFVSNIPSAEAGGRKRHHGFGHYASWIPTYLTEDLDETAQDSGAPGNMWAGTGLPATNFILRRYEHAGIELAIKAHLRYGSDIPATYVDGHGLVHVEVPAGPQPGTTNRAKWNFAFSYDVALDPGNPDLEDYRGYLMIDVDPSPRTRYLKLKLTKLTAPSGQNNGYGWVTASTIPIGDDEGTSQVTQNSQNLAFYEDYIDADPHTPGRQSYMATGFGPGEFDVKMLLQRKYSRRKAELHVVFDVVDP